MAACTRERYIGATRVVVGENLDFEELLGFVPEDGALAVFFDSKLGEYADDLIGRLKRTYRVYAYPIPSARSALRASFNKHEVPEFARHIFAIGAGSCAEAAKRAAEELKIEWSLLLSAPSTDKILQGKLPKSVFIERNLMINCPCECKAAGYGILFSEPLVAFEGLFANKILAENEKEFEVHGEVEDVCELAVALLVSSSRTKHADSAEIMARLLYMRAAKQGKRPRLTGEYKFLASSLLMSFYSSFLGSPAIDVMPPSDLAAAADVVGYLNARDIIPSKKVDFFDRNAYFRISYILGEYRLDLLDRLSSADMKSAGRYWRRLYPDAGYWLKTELTSRDMLSCLSLAGAFSDSLLGYAFASGVLSDV